MTDYLSQAADPVEVLCPESPLMLAVTIKDELGNIDLKSIIAGETAVSLSPEQTKD